MVFTIARKAKLKDDGILFCGNNAKDVTGSMIYIRFANKQILLESEKCGIREPQGRKNLVKRLVIITIVLINCIFELKILKFF